MARRTVFLLLAFSLLAFPAYAFEFGLFKSGTASIGMGCYDVKTADLNGDGYADAVAAVYDTHTLAVVLGTPDGFGAKSLYVAGNAVAVDLADFDGDGDVDILEGDWNQNAIRLWKNQGDGSLLSTPSNSVSGPVRDLVSGDFDGNGTRDAVVVTGPGKVVYLPGVSGGGFGPAVTSTTIFSALKGIAAGDLDLDGDLDFVVIDPVANRLVRFRNDGLPSFPFSLDAQAVLSGHPSDVALSDLDGDGMLDAAASMENGLVAVLRGTASQFELPPLTFPVGTLSQSVQVADFDHEGGLDLLVSNYSQSTITVLRNQGGLLFAGSVTGTTGKSPRSAAAGDMNGDGLMDVVSGDYEAGTATLNVSRMGPGQLLYSPRKLDFGTGYQNLADHRVLQLQNVGLSTLIVTPGPIDGDQFEYTGPSTPFSLAPGAQETIQVRCVRTTLGDATGTLHLTTTDPAAPTIEIPLSATTLPADPQLAYAPTALGFGEDFVGNEQLLHVELLNTGHAPLDVNPTIENDEFVLDDTTGPFTIPVDQGKWLWVKYRRTVVGQASGTLHLSTNDPVQPEVTIALSGSAFLALPKLAYTPSPLNFGSDYVGNQAVLSIQLTNVGHALLTVTPGAIDGDQFAYAGSTNPIVITVGSSAPLPIRYLRLSGGPAAGAVHLATDDPDLSEVTIPLEGYAGPPPAADVSAPPPAKLQIGTTQQARIVVRNTGGSPLHITVPSFVGDLVETPGLDLGSTDQDYVRFDASGAAWNLDWEGKVISGERGEYMGGMDESNFLVQSGGILGLGGRELRLGPVAVAPGIEVTRKIYVPQSGSWARFIDVAYNPNDNARVATFDLIDNIGYTINAPIRTSDGDALFELTDDWIVAPGASDRRVVGRIFRSVGAANVPAVATWFATTAAPGSYSRTKFVTTLAPHDRACVVQWAIQGEDVNAATAAVEALRQDPSAGLVDADAIDRGSVWNLARDPRPFRPEAGSHTIAPGDSVEIPVVFGAEAASHDADLAGVLRIATDDPARRTLSVPLAFSIVIGPVVGIPGDPNGSSLALAGFLPNPVRLSGTARVAFRLSTREPVTLTLYDVRGRALARQLIESPAPGPGSVVLPGASLAPGVVWMRLEQGGRIATAKGIVLP